ncbi:MAG TPA: DUF6049 family protein [Pyrinomonadaceae bacterium]|nr:DUF6049 family protein [Pyrinomonadaceae bacterium]
MTLRPALSLLLIWSTLVTVLPARGAPAATDQDSDVTDTSDGLRFRLSEVREAEGSKPASPTVNPVTPATVLSASESNRLLARLPSLKPERDDTLNFKLRERSLPPPRAGETIQAAFTLSRNAGPPLPAITNAPLEVMRFAPEGEVGLAPNLSITFSQPMVAVASQEEAAARMPVKISPQPSGKWRWLGTNTLMFQPDAEGGRLPMATNYTVTIPAGTTSALGNQLRETRTFSFATPPPQLSGYYPTRESVARDALMFLEFDQRIDAARVLEYLKLQPADSEIRLRLASPEEIAADVAISDHVKNAVKGRWMVLRAVGANGATRDVLPSGTLLRVSLAAGAPSGEGARKTTAEQGFNFTTYGPMRVADTQCGYLQACTPFDSLRITLSNQLDTDTFDAAKVRIEPEIPGVKIQGSYKQITIDGAKRSNINYTVTLDRTIKDTFNQTLTGDNTFTFRVNKSSPSLFSASSGLVALDPAGPRAFNVYSINYARLRVMLFKVTSGDWPQFQRYLAVPSTNPNQPAQPPGRLFSDKVIEIKAAPDQLAETSIDISTALDEGYGQVFVKVVPALGGDGKNEPVTVYPYRPNVAEAWVQSTGIALDAFADSRELVVWTNSLKDGAPLTGVELTVSPDELNAVTGADGLARLNFRVRPNVNAKLPALLVARRGKDVAILPQNEPLQSRHLSTLASRSWRRDEARNSLSWYVFDDRKLYRPGEEVNIKGWVRTVDLTPTGDTEMYKAKPGETLGYVLTDSQDNEISKGKVKLNALAGFNIKLQLPATMNLGEASVRFEFGEDRGHDHSFQVQEFRRPEFEINTKASEAPHFVGSSATVTMTAAYYSGGGLADTEVRWDVVAVPTNFTPPNRDEYTFGKFFPWWGDYYDHGNRTEQLFQGRTDADGKHTLKLDFDSVSPARPSNVTVAALLQDVNRQAVSSSTSLIVHPADVYVGVKSARSFIQKGQAFDIATIVTDIDGKAIAGREVRLRFVRLEHVFKKGVWQEQERDPQEQTLTSASDAVNARFQSTLGGMYRLTARVRDERGRLNESELSLWVAGGRLRPNRDVAEENVELIPDRRTYADNDVAEILVQSPFAPAEGVMTIRRSGLLRSERFTMSESSHTLRIPIAEAMTPNVHVQVDLVGAAGRVDEQGDELANLPKRPAFASGEIKLEIPPVKRRLAVTATPRQKELEPGGETIVDVEVKDAQGKGVAGTDTAVVVVDESVLTMANYRLSEPWVIFYEDRTENVDDYHLRKNVTLANPEEVQRLQAAGGGGGGRGDLDPSQALSGLRSMQSLYKLADLQRGIAMNSTTSETVNVTGSADDPIITRKNFDALAVFAASLPTDAQGRAQLKVKLPDNLTRYRVLAVSVAGGKLSGASSESVITARKQLMARPSAPRFLNYGDAAELPVVLQNQTDAAMTVRVAVRATNAGLPAGAGRQVAVPANNRVEVRFPIEAMKPGTARFQIVAASGTMTDAAEISLPVYTPATVEAFATYGVIDNGAIAQPVIAPADAVKTFGGLEITTASTQLQELTDAVIYLVNYPYSCSEQIASRVIAIAALKDVLTAFKARDLPSPKSLRDSVSSDLKLLEALQNDDGGFGFWRQGQPSFPYVSIHVAHALARAKTKGFKVNESVLEEAEEYLDEIDSKIPSEYSPESRRAIQAYALYVRALMDDRDLAEARELIANAGGVEKLSLESLGWLLPVLSGDPASSKEVDAIRRHLNNRVTETAAAAHFADSYSDGAYTILHSDRRADGVILEALIGDQPQNDLIPKLVRGILSDRRRGRWMNTQENVFILLALDRYFNTYERMTPDFVARVWLGNDYAGEQGFKGRSIDRQQLNLPMALLAERTANAPVNLTIAKEGAGRLYFRIGTKYAPSSVKIAAADYGFLVERKYEAVDNPQDVQREADGGWLIKAGARVRVRVTMSNPARRYHVALVDPLPAGLEPLNPELATTEKLPADSSSNRDGKGIFDSYRYWRGTWYEHQNLRDERVEAFTLMLWEGVHEYTYFARATTPGLFVVPPSRAEEMYAPETFGRGQSDRVRVQ